MELGLRVARLAARAGREGTSACSRCCASNSAASLACAPKSRRQTGANPVPIRCNNSTAAPPQLHQSGGRTERGPRTRGAAPHHLRVLRLLLLELLRRERLLLLLLQGERTLLHSPSYNSAYSSAFE
jgi:hypothetical protein